MAKLNVFKAALSAGQVTLVILAVLNSVISAAYYLRVLVALYMQPKGASTTVPKFNGMLAIGAVACVVLLLFWGIQPASLLAISSF